MDIQEYSSTQTLCIQAFPKVNISLKIGAKRGNLHTLQSRFCLVESDLCDIMLFVKLPYQPNHTLSHASQQNRSYNGESAMLLSGDFDCQIEQNLITKAYHALLNHAKANPTSTYQQEIHANKIHINRTPHTLHIMVAKQIPTGGGLGGGSANAAITLLALNELLGFHFDMPTLCALAKTLGSDIAFFLLVYTQNSTQIAPYFALRDSFTQKEITAYSDYFAIHGSFPDTLFGALDMQKSGHSLQFMSANVFGIGDEIIPFYEKPPKIRIHCNQIACNTGAVYGEFARLYSQPNLNQALHKDSQNRDQNKGLHNKQDSQYSMENANNQKTHQNTQYSHPLTSPYHTTHTNTQCSAQETQSLIDLTQDSNTLLQKHTPHFLNDLYAPACNLYPLRQIEEELRRVYGRVYFSGSGSSFFSVEC